MYTFPSTEKRFRSKPSYPSKIIAGKSLVHNEFVGDIGFQASFNQLRRATKPVSGIP